jgi:hypothetical protein
MSQHTIMDDLLFSKHSLGVSWATTLSCQARLQSFCSAVAMERPTSPESADDLPPDCLSRLDTQGVRSVSMRPFCTVERCLPVGAKSLPTVLSVDESVKVTP